MLKRLLMISPIIFLLSGLLSACSTGEGGETSYPKSKEEREWEKVGKLSGDEGLVIVGGKKKSAGTAGINVNSFLWKAALDVVHKMPLLSADPFGGTILTDWHKPTADSKERYKLNVFIIGAELRSDAARVTVFKQIQDGRGQWVDTVVPDELSTQIEDKILLTARNMKFSAGS